MTVSATCPTPTPFTPCVLHSVVASRASRRHSHLQLTRGMAWMAINQEPACDWHLGWQWEEKGWYLAYPCCVLQLGCILGDKPSSSENLCCPAYPSIWFTVLMHRTQLLKDKRMKYTFPGLWRTTLPKFINIIKCNSAFKGTCQKWHWARTLSFVSFLSGPQGFIQIQ